MKRRVWNHLASIFKGMKVISVIGDVKYNGCLAGLNIPLLILWLNFI